MTNPLEPMDTADRMILFLLRRVYPCFGFAYVLLNLYQGDFGTAGALMVTSAGCTRLDDWR